MRRVVFKERPEELEEKIGTDGVEELEDLINFFLDYNEIKLREEKLYAYSGESHSRSRNVVRDLEAPKIPAYMTKVLRKKLGKPAFTELIKFLNLTAFGKPDEIIHEDVPDEEYGDYTGESTGGRYTS